MYTLKNGVRNTMLSFNFGDGSFSKIYYILLALFVISIFVGIFLLMNKKPQKPKTQKQ